MLIAMLLKSLGYPRHESFQPSDPQQMQSLVVWIENTKIRHYPLDGRAHLQTTDATAWPAALQQYLSDLGCPVAWAGGANAEAVAQWILSHAVGLEYQDTSEAYNDTISRSVDAAQRPEDWVPSRLPPFPDIAAPETHAALRSVLKSLRLPEAAAAADGAASNNKILSIETLHQARAVLESQIVPTLAEAEKDPTSRVTSAAALARFPLGFSTGDADVDVAATVLRMLYIKDLRALQTRVDEAIVAGQEITADPRTDAAIGRDGR